MVYSGGSVTIVSGKNKVQKVKSIMSQMLEDMAFDAVQSLEKEVRKFSFVFKI